MMGRLVGFLVRVDGCPGDRPVELSDYYLHRVITSWLQVGAVFVAAAALLLSMKKASRDAKRALTAVAHDGFLKFVKLSAEYPDLYLMQPEKRPNKELSFSEREIERSAFVLLLSTYERLFLDAGCTNQLEKLREIEKLITVYAGYDQFQEACLLYIAFSENKFAKHLNALIKQ